MLLGFTYVMSGRRRYITLKSNKKNSSDTVLRINFMSQIFYFSYQLKISIFIINMIKLIRFMDKTHVIVSQETWL